MNIKVVSITFQWKNTSCQNTPTKSPTKKYDPQYDPQNKAMTNKIRLRNTKMTRKIRICNNNGTQQSQKCMTNTILFDLNQNRSKQISLDQIVSVQQV